MTKLKANYNLLLPDGKTEVKIGDEFEFEGDYSSFASCVSVIEEGKKKEGKTPEENAEEKAIREKARLLGIRSYHNKGLQKLKDEIAEKEGETSTPAPAPESAPADTPAHVEGKTETPEEGKDNV